MDLELSDEQKLIVANVRRFIREEIRPLERELDPDAYTLQPEDHERLVGMTEEMGLLNMQVDTVTRTLVAEEMSQHNAGLYAPAYGVFSRREGGAEGGGGFLGLSEPSGGSDPARAIQTRAVRDGDEWVLNGSKLWTSGADTADSGIVYARTDLEKGRAGISAFRVPTDTPGFRVERLVQVLRSHYTTEISFTDMRLPLQAMLGGEGSGFARANDTLSHNRIPYAVGCLGVAVYATELAVDWAKQRVTFGEPLANRQAIQWMLVDNEIDIRTGRWIALDAAAKAQRGEPFRFESSMAKLLCTEGAGRVVDRSMQIFGGLGMSKDMPFERWYRELRIRRVGEGPSEIQRVVMAREILNVGSGS
ncbi:MAG: acyl-CoA dehydrogenase family protein [Dehalococcoidia bacterium]|nr:acyl-CoA dehydrogenase family protein [Dehalococcoidia bacterium]